MDTPARTVRIATWNLERPKWNGHEKNRHRFTKIEEIDADLWVLTETNSAIDLTGRGYTAIESLPIPAYHENGEHLSTIWTRWKVRESIATFDRSIAVRAEVESPFGPMLVYGTVIPYANERGANGTVRRWEEHRRSLRLHHEDWSRLKRLYPEHLMCVAGDFNQSRDSSGWYEDRESVALLTGFLRDLGLKCITEADMRARGLSRASIDHICLSEELSGRFDRLDAWEGTTGDGVKMSDHNGIFVEATNP